MMVTSYGCDRWLKFTQKSTENTIQPRIHLSDPVKFSWYEVKEVHDINTGHFGFILKRVQPGPDRPLALRSVDVQYK